MEKFSRPQNETPLSPEETQKVVAALEAWKIVGFLLGEINIPDVTASEARAELEEILKSYTLSEIVAVLFQESRKAKAGHKIILAQGILDFSRMFDRADFDKALADSMTNVPTLLELIEQGKKEDAESTLKGRISSKVNKFLKGE
jgi:hypothetical protein